MIPFWLRAMPLWCPRYCFKLDKKYLTNRKQFVVYDDICSDYRIMLYGIPQGPILFLLYITELANISKFIFFADGINVFCAG